MTEIKAHAAGVRHLLEGKINLGTILDIGGQDSKVISLHSSGRVLKFEMNDRCAAGTGKFLEIMAESLGYQIESFGQEASRAENELSISSMCAVFAESEVTFLLAKGEDRRDISYALHCSIARRASAMLKKLMDDRAVAFTWGVARNSFLAQLISSMVGKKEQIYF